MKTSVLTLLFGCLSLVASAQHARKITGGCSVVVTHPLMRTTGIGDTVTLNNITSDTLVAYPAGIADSGWVTGTNLFNDRGFAERYDFNGTDSSAHVLGVIAQFTGSINPSSTHNINFKVWKVGPEQLIAPHLLYTGMPGACIDTITVPFTRIALDTDGTTLNTFMFPSATPPFASSFFVGFDIDYDFATLNGDTLAVLSSPDGMRNTAAFWLRNNVDTTTDTLLFVQNATQYADNIWHDNYQDNFGLFNNLAIYPIVLIDEPAALAHVTRGNLSLFNCYPNPATNSATVKYALQQTDNVMFRVYDQTGRILEKQEYRTLQPGEQAININTSTMPNGTYYYLIQTGSGAGIGGQLVVSR
ncbi:MAG: T9SS C-terminal target domain-containing protein [Chitinophagia bacterium]|nr:T9SS C-terminal target domain-containing protein [Chitinophagia bacterium]